MRQFMGMLLVLTALGIASCNPSMNVERSALRAGGDLSAVLYLEHNDHIAPGVLKAGAEKVLAFVETGNLAALPLAEVERKLRELAPPQVAGLIDSALLAATAHAVDVQQAIGASNLKRIRAYIVGIITGATQYESATTANWRRGARSPEDYAGPAQAGQAGWISRVATTLPHAGDRQT